MGNCVGVRLDTIQNRENACTIFGHSHFFLISNLRPRNLVTFPKIHPKTIWYTNSLTMKFYVTMATIFDKRSF